MAIRSLKKMFQSSLLKSTSASFGLIILIAGCGSQTQESELLHDVDQPTRGTEGWMWSNVPDQSYHNVIAPLLDLDNGKYLAADHELTKWTQQWVDRIDAKLRQEHAAALVNTPKPIAKVIKQSSANAFVAPVPVCYNVKVKLKNGSENSANTLDNVYLDARDGEFSSWPAQYKCVSGDSSEIKSFVNNYNAASVGCRFTFSGSVLEGNSQCGRSTDIGSIVAAKKLVLLQTANYVTVHTGIFALMSEEALISVIAHELGHYYRAHVAGAMKEFDFFYTMDRNSTDSRPRPEPAKKQMGDAAVAGSTLLNGSDSYTAISTQTIRPELFMAVGTVVSKVCSSASCPTACKPVSTLIKSSEFVSAMSTYPFAEATPAMISVYKDFEEKAASCFAAIKMTSSDTITPTTIGYRKFVSYVSSPEWPTWLDRIGAGGKSYVARMGSLAASRAGSAAPSGQTLDRVLATLSKKFDGQDDAGEAALKAAYDAHLGQYTAEQEADEFAAEVVNDIGVEPKHVVDAMASLGKGSPNSLRGFSLGQQDCEALWRRNWLDDSGSYAFVPIGDFSEVHHSSCFRMFNLDREIAAHRYQTPSVDVPLLSASGWRSLQVTASNLSGEEEHAVDGHGVAPFMKKSSLGTCQYAGSYH